jgi:gluconate 2-dehydrogenase subunit 3-like protein
MPPAALAPVRPVFRAFVSTIVPEAAAFDEPQWAELETLVEAVLRDRPPALKRQLRLALRLLQGLPVLRFGHRFTALDPARRARCLARLESHSIPSVRLGFWGLRTLALLGYYGRPAAGKAIGWAADARGWEALR